MNKSEYYERKYKDGLELQEKYDKERKERQEKADKERERKKRSDFVFGRDGKGSIFALVFLVLFIVVFVRTLLNSEISVTLSGFLDMLASVPDVSLSWLTNIDLVITGNWGVLDFLRLFINSLGDIFEILLMLAGGLIQLITYMGYFLRYLFML